MALAPDIVNRRFRSRTKWEGLTVGTVSSFKMQNVGTVPTFEMHNIGTVPTFKMHNVGTVPAGLDILAHAPINLVETNKSILAKMEGC